MRKEQEMKIELKKNIMEINIKLRAAEEESRRFQEEKVNLEHALNMLRRNQNKLLSKIKESSEFVDYCIDFMKKNGVMSTSFLSDNVPY